MPRVGLVADDDPWVRSHGLGELRRAQALIEKSRATRIAKGCGRKPKDVHDLVKRFDQMRDMMRALGDGGGGMLGKIPGMGRLAGAGGMDPAALLGGGGVPRGTSAQRRKGADAQRKRKRQQAKKDRKRKKKKR